MKKKENDMIKVTELEGQLIDRRDEIIKRLHSIDLDKKKVNGPLSAKFDDQAVSMQNNEVVDEIDNIDRKELGEIKSALERIKAETYGICIECGEKISDNRLKALPYAPLCLECSNE
jgi:DnaK suppressor protein